MQSKTVYKPIFLGRSEIDVDLWNRCILKAKNRRIYAYSWWLDAVSEGNWSAIVDDSTDYKIVMPVLITTKALIIKRILRPFLTQQLGIFSPSVIEKGIEKAFFDVMNNMAHYIDLTIHEGHAKDEGELSNLTNHIIRLQSSKDYNRLTKRNIKAALESGFKFNMDIDYEGVLSFMVDHMPYKLSTAEVKKCENIVQAAKALDILDVWKSFDENNDITCSALCIRDIERVYLILIASTESGKVKSHAYALIDKMIQHYKAKRFEVFDFTGSNMENIARRNLGFGAEVETYFRLKKKIF